MKYILCLTLLTSGAYCSQEKENNPRRKYSIAQLRSLDPARLIKTKEIMPHAVIQDPKKEWQNAMKRKVLEHIVAATPTNTPASNVTPVNSPDQKGISVNDVTFTFEAL